MNFMKLTKARFLNVIFKTLSSWALYIQSDVSGAASKDGKASS